MTREEYLNKLVETFKDFKFFPEDHHYEYKGERIGCSVTKLIEEYTQEFDKELIAQRVANKNGKSIEEVLNEWKYKNEFSKAKGTTCHCYIQSLWNGTEYNEMMFDGSLEFLKVVNKIQVQAKLFKNDYEEFIEHVVDELVIGSKQFEIASCVDHVFRNKKTGGLILVDYKTNSDIYKGDKYAGKMKPPLENLKDSTLIHYNLQLSIYRYLIEKYSGLEVENCFIVWMSEENETYKVLNVSYLKNEVENILEWRKWL